MTRTRTSLGMRLRNLFIVLLAFAAIIAVTGPTVASYAKTEYRAWEINTTQYKRANGHWTTLTLPKDVRVNAVHAALLYTGEILIVAGSGNDADAFKAGTFKTLLYNPVTDSTTLIPTPKDMFCGGHAYLPDGNLLVAGGTRKYEVEAAQVTTAAGIMTVKNDSTDGPVTIAKGARVVSQSGIPFVTTEDVVVPAATTMTMDGAPMTMTGENTVWVQAVHPGKASIIASEQQFDFSGDPTLYRSVYGVADKLTMQKQDFEGITASYIYDVQKRRYEQTSDLQFARWYPTLVSVNGGNVLAVSGLDQHGQILPGNNEVFDLKTHTWKENKALFRYFPTYPALFRLADGDLFYSGSNAGYGSATQGRTPGIWHLGTNTFTETPGIPDATDLETSGSILLPPVQQQKVMVVGGGGVGDVTASTARTSIIDLSAASTAAGKKATYTWTPGPSLPAPTRYPEVVALPDDSVFISGGSSDYRGRSGTDLHQSMLYDQKTNSLRAVAANSIGRDYHSEALLLPDGRVVTLGGNPLFADPKNTTPGGFEQRIEIYSPPYLYDGEARPVITSAPKQVKRGTTITVGATGDVATARLMRPSATTHVTDLEQRSIALTVKQSADGLKLSIPKKEGLVPSGWYMLFLVSARGTPSVAQWVKVP